MFCTDGRGLTVHVLGVPRLPAVPDLLQPALRSAGGPGSFGPDQLAQFPDPADVLKGRVAAAVSDDGGEVDRGALLGRGRSQDRRVRGQRVPQQVRVHLLVPGLGAEVPGDVRDVRDRQGGEGQAGHEQTQTGQQHTSSGVKHGEHVGGDRRTEPGRQTGSTCFRLSCFVDVPGLCDL